MMAEEKTKGTEKAHHEAKPAAHHEAKHAAKPVAKEQPKKAAKEAPKEKKKPPYRISRSPEARKMAREKSRVEKKKGKFQRQNFKKLKRIKDRWRRPIGIDNGHQNDKKCKPAHPRTGYMTPQDVRGMHPSGYWPVRVFNVSDLSELDSKKEAAIIAATVGKKKRLEIQKAAQAKGIQILNYKE